MTLTTQVRAGISAKLVGSADFANPVFDLPAHADISILSGAVDGKADLLFSDQRTLAADANEDLDLAGGLLDPLGATLTFVDVVAILLRAAAANANLVNMKPATVSGFLGPFGDASDVVSVQPGGVALFVAPNAGWPVTAGTGDLLNIANGGSVTPVTYDIIIVGRSA